MNNVIKRTWLQNKMVSVEWIGTAFQAESGGHTFEISGADGNGNAVALSGTVSGVFLRPDNTDVAITGAASGGVASVTLPAECYAVPGQFGLAIYVTADGQKTAVYSAIGTVARTSSGTVAPGATADVVDLINRISAAVATIPASWSGLMADIAPTYSESAVYPVGAYVYYNGDLYKCTTAISTAETWTAAHWTAAVIGNDLSNLNSALNGMTTATAEDEGKALKVKTVEEGTVTEWEFGEAGGDYDDVLANTVIVTSRTPALSVTSKKTWIDSNGVATLADNTMANYRASNAVEVLPGDEVKLTFQPSGHAVGAKAILVTDAEYNIMLTIDAPSSGLPIVSHEFVVPADGAYFMLNVWAQGSVSNFTITTTSKYPVALQKDLDAVDGRIESIESFDTELVLDTSATNNLMDYRPFVEGTISDQTGVFTPVVAPTTYKYICSGFIPVEAGVTYYIRRTNDASVSSSCQGYYYYASDKSYINGQTGNNATYWNRWTIPDGVKFMRVFLYIGKGAESFDSIPEYAKTWGLFEYGTDKTKPLFVPLTTIAPDRRVDFTVDTRAFAGKTIAVLGDSIGTRKGYNDPEILITEADVGVELSAYLTYNDVQAGLSIAGHTYTDDEIGTEVTFTPTADDVGKSIGVPLNHGGADAIKWWQMLCVKLGMTAENASWSGTTMVSAGSRSTTRKNYYASCAWYEPTIRRCGIRTPGTMTRTAPDYIFIHRGVNDFSLEHAGNVTVLTDNPFSAWDYAIPDTDQIEADGATKFDFKQAYAMTIQKLRDAYPTAKIICCTLTPFRRNHETHYPPNNGHYNLPAFNKAIREVAEFFGCPVCEFAEAYTYEDLSSYSGDGTHPNEYGHRSMYERALLCLVNNAKVDC